MVPPVPPPGPAEGSRASPQPASASATAIVRIALILMAHLLEREPGGGAEVEAELAFVLELFARDHVEHADAAVQVQVPRLGLPAPAHTHRATHRTRGVHVEVDDQLARVDRLELPEESVR